LLDRQQRQAVLLGRLLQVLERHAGVGQLLEQVDARLALFPIEALEQALRLEVDLAHSPSRSSPRIRSSVMVAGSVERMNSSSVFTKRTGSSRYGKWPAPGKLTKRLPGIASAASAPCLAGMI